ncbi:MAG: hypothetical protein DMG13_14295 [Acidobacteria bacterium]|nr:MAG: hypothetical protein DMG13_14295 [Acidobacteriota bacterium]
MSNNFSVFSASEDKSRYIEARYARMTRIPQISTKFRKKDRGIPAAVSHIPSRNYRHPDEIVPARTEIVENGGENTSENRPDWCASAPVVQVR